MNGDIQVAVFFAGLILFASDPYTDRVTQAVLVDGRPAEGASTGNLDDCDNLIDADGHHFPMVTWRVGDGPVSLAGGPAFVSPGGQILDHRGEIVFHWLCATGGGGIRLCGYESAGYSEHQGALPSPGCATGIGKVRDPGACPVGPRSDGLPRLPSEEHLDPGADGRRSFYWVPSFDELGAPRRVKRSVLDTKGPDVPDTVFARVPLSHGRISSGDFGWVENSNGRWIPRLRCEREGRRVMRRAASEVVAWEPAPPPQAVKLLISLRRYSDSREVELARLPLDQGPVRVVVSNSPKQRCHGRRHPGRKPGVEVAHFHKLETLLVADRATGGASENAATQAHEFSLEVPDRMWKSWPFKNAIAYAEWYPKFVTIAKWLGSPKTTASQDASSPWGDLADSVGTYQRPICIPGGGSG